MTKLLRVSGRLKPTHAQLFNNEQLVEEMFTVTHPNRPAEPFPTQERAEKRFVELIPDLG